MKQAVLVLSLIMLSGIPITPLLPGGYFFSGSEASAEEAWRAELDELCSKSNSAMNFSRIELKTLIERCDKLKPRIDALDETTRKVYGRRLQMCRDFYAFMLENRKDTPPS